MSQKHTGKRTRKDYYALSAKREKRGTVDPGQNNQGAIISFDRNKRSTCVRECFRLFEEYSEKFYPKQESTNEEEEGLNNQPLDVAAAIAAELEELQEKKETKSTTTIKVRDVNCNCLLFLQISLPETESSVEFFRKIFKDIQETRKAKTRFLHKLVPIQRTCVASLATITTNLEPLLKQVFLPDIAPITYSIQFKARNNSSIKRDDIHKIVFGVVKRPHKVDLNDPSCVIIIEVISSFCALSVIQNYPDFHEFKIRTMQEAFLPSASLGKPEVSLEETKDDKPDVVAGTTETIGESKQQEVVVPSEKGEAVDQ